MILHMLTILSNWSYIMYIDYDMNCEPCMLGMVGNGQKLLVDNALVIFVVKCLLI